MASGIFFFGYLLFEVPSNLLLEKIGARFWIARIMITWGIISGATLFVKSAAAFYAVRFLLGFAAASPLVHGVLARSRSLNNSATPSRKLGYLSAHPNPRSFWLLTFLLVQPRFRFRSRGTKGGKGCPSWAQTH